MVTLNRIRIIGLTSMIFSGGCKPEPNAFIKFFNKNNLTPKKIFFLGNRLVDMELADRIKKELGIKVLKCLIRRDKIRSDYADIIVNDLLSALLLIKKFNPDIVMSDFDNTLVYTGYDYYEKKVEHIRFWEKHSRNKLLLITYWFFSNIINPFIKRRPYKLRNDNTELFIKKLDKPLIIHSMTPDWIIKLIIKRIVKARN